MANGVVYPRSKPLEIVERIIRNRALSNLDHHYLDTKSGRIYAALGTDSANRYIGIWAFTRHPPVARVLEFNPNQSKALCLKTLFEDGAGMLVEMEAKGLMNEEIHFSA